MKIYLACMAAFTLFQWWLFLRALQAVRRSDRELWTRVNRIRKEPGDLSIALEALTVIEQDQTGYPRIQAAIALDKIAGCYPMRRGETVEQFAARMREYDK